MLSKAVDTLKGKKGMIDRLSLEPVPKFIFPIPQRLSLFPTIGGLKIKSKFSQFSQFLANQKVKISRNQENFEKIRESEKNVKLSAQCHGIANALIAYGYWKGGSRNI